jgi:hypothetical protein
MRVINTRCIFLRETLDPEMTDIANANWYDIDILLTAEGHIF